MSRIAFLGRPGSGKTRLANKMGKELGYQVYDNIPQKFAKATDIAIGFPSDYRVELMLASERMKHILTHWDEDNVIYTSTVLDSLAYARIRQIMALESKSMDLPEDQAVLEATYSMVALFFYTCTHTFKFDKVYFIRTFDDAEFASIKENPDEFDIDHAIEASLVDVMETFTELKDHVEIIDRTRDGRVPRRKVAQG